MHGSYRFLEIESDFHIYSSANDVEALAASFPDYAPFRYAQPRAQPYRLIFQVLPGLLVLGAGGMHASIDEDAASAVPQAGQEASPSPAADIGPSANPTFTVDDARPQIATSPVSLPVTPSAAEPVATTPDPIDVDSGLPETVPSAVAQEPKLSDAAEVENPTEKTLQHVNQGDKTALPVLVDGKHAGELEFLDSDRLISVRLGSLLELVSDRFEPAEYQRLAASPAAQEFIPVDDLSAAGLEISYDPVYDEFNLAAGPNDQAQVPSEYS